MLQMGHDWGWLDSEQDYPNDSELSNDCRSLFSSWDSSFDLDLGSWRETEKPGAEELEESSPGREASELLVRDGGSEESQEEAEQVSRQNLLFLSEVAYLMEPLCISSKESSEGCCPSSGTRQEAREIEATEGKGEPNREPEELSAKEDHLVAEKSSLGENGRPEVTPPPSDISALQEQSVESKEGGVQQESKEEDQGEGYVSEMEDQRSSGECDDGCSAQETPLVDILFSRATSSKLSDLCHGDPVQDHLLFKKTLLPVWKMIASHRFSSPFLKPVSERQAPGYKDVVKRPMDLTSLKRNLSKGRIRTMAQFQRDLMLMFQNAVMYNDSDHHVYHMAMEMQREVLEQIQVLSIWLDKRRDLNSLE
ncbi:bromodomain-containing protein 8-like isoform X2 [Ovis aries]|uniref:bromodomain-containing protein 8-like isoform X2 n=1 Tax=Ovis aries TaxID=9940 RepID=UPI00295287D1|nr:bromodomain-containing protein 8-like isoform X2 [Ovis aries]